MIRCQLLSDEGGKSTGSKEDWTLDVETNTLRHALAVSFAGNENVAGEPTWEWAMKDCKSLPIDDKIHVIRFVMSFYLLEDTRADSFQLCSVNPKTNEITSFASVREYDSQTEKPSWFKKIRHGLQWSVDLVNLFIVYKDGLPSLFTEKKWKEESNRLENKMKGFDEKIAKWHQELLPKGQHWYVHMVGVNPENQGEGKGKALMQKLNEMADKSNQLMYLEAGDPNRKFYEKVGFQVQRTETLVDPVDPNDTYLFHLMTRCPNISK